MQILVCDDAAPVRQTLARALESSRALQRSGSVRVLEANRAEEAIILVLGGTIDLVVMDHELPAMTGADAVRKLRDDGSSVPIVMLTGAAIPAVETLRPLIDGHLIKGEAAISDVVDAVLAITASGQTLRKRSSHPRR